MWRSEMVFEGVLGGFGVWLGWGIGRQQQQKQKARRGGAPWSEKKKDAFLLILV